MHFLPRLLHTITGRERELFTFGEIEWSEHSWTHNIFRFYECIFGRKIGIRAEISCCVSKNKIYYAAHSWEGVFALSEQAVREFLRTIRLPIKVWVPLLQTPIGIPLFASPYLFAIAWDAAADGGTSTTGSLTWSHTCTGSNGYLVVSTVQAVEASDDITTMTYNLSTMTKIGGIQSPSDRFLGLWNIVGPSTGSHSIVISFTGNFMEGGSTSYSGVKQTGQPDSSHTNTGGVSTSYSDSTTVVASGCWLVGNAHNTGRNVSPAGGAAGRSPASAGTQDYTLEDTNATVGTGSQSLSWSAAAGAGGWGSVIASFAPAAAGATTRTFRTLLGVGT